MNDQITKIDVPDEPIFNFNDKLYTPFDFNTNKIRYMITKIKNNTACLNLECSGFMIGKIQIPLEFVSKLKECNISQMEFGPLHV